MNSAATDSDHIPCTVYSVENHPADSRVNLDESGKVQTLTSRMGTGGGNVPMIVARGTSAVCYKKPPHYIVRRLTPTECARLQGFPDRWGDIDHKETMNDEDYAFWLEVRQTYDRINGRAKKYYTEKKILSWYNKLHNDGAEYKMWGNGIALPCALYVMEGIVNHSAGLCLTGCAIEILGGKT